MKILVTGGAGFIGSHYVSHVLALGHSVIVLDNLSNSSGLPLINSLSSGPLEFIEGSIIDESLVDQLVSQSDLVVNFAAWTHNDTALSSPEVFFETNVMGLCVLLQAAVRHSKRFHQVSTDEVYGDIPLESDHEFKESSLLRPSNPYSSSKAAGDLMIQSWARSFGLQASISITCNNFGTYQNLEKFIPRQITRIIQGLSVELYGLGTNVREWIPVSRNVAYIHLIASSRHVGRKFNIGTGQRYSNKEIVETIIKVSERSDVQIDFISDRPGHDLKYALNSQDFFSTFNVPKLGFALEDELRAIFIWFQLNKELWAS